MPNLFSIDVPASNSAASPTRVNPPAIMLLLLIALPVCADEQAKNAPTKDERPWIKLFNGKDLDNFQTVGSAKWRVEDGVIVGGQDGDPKRSGLIMTKKQFKNFELELEFMIDEHGKYNSGVYLRNAPNTGRRRGYQVNIGRGVAGEPVGLFLHDWLDKGDEKDEIRKPREWNHLRIVANGGHIIVDLNGKRIVDYKDPDPSPELLEPGVIAFQTYGAEGHAGWVKFRGVRARALGK